MLKKGDIIIIACVTAVMLISAAALFVPKAHGTTVTIKKDNEVLYKVSLSEECTLELDGNTVCVKNGDTKVIEYQGDGVLLATSTGSTGYSLSAGGPVVDPSMDALLLTPLCPHTLTARSYIFRPESVLTLTVPNAEKESVYYAVDGRSGQPLTPADTLTVYRSAQKARFLHIKHREFYDVLRHKIINRNE